MNTTIANKKLSSNKQTITVASTDVTPTMLKVPAIVFGKNYRKYISDTALKELASDISAHGMISPVTVREISAGRYELVVGQRRLKAAILAGQLTVPAIIRNFTDEEITEIQLSENYNRVDPHPLDDAFGILELQDSGMAMDDIALRLGKSKSFIFNRLKLAQLTEQLQEVFYANKFSLAEALELSYLSANSQSEFFEQYCDNWKADDFSISNLRYLLDRFKCDLTRACFNTSDTALIPDCGSCLNCPFNSATLQSLFPEMSKQAICTNKSCFERKCQANAEKVVKSSIAKENPVGLITCINTPDDFLQAIDTLPETAEIPKYDSRAVRTIPVPQAPEKSDYTDEEDNNNFDQQGFELELQEYQSELSEFNEGIKAGQILKGLNFGWKGVQPVFFSPEISDEKAVQQVTAKQVQEAIKGKTATAEMLKAEIQRLENREIRAKERDKEKIQLKVHELFSQSLSEDVSTYTMNPGDVAATRFIVYDALDYSVRSVVKNALFPDGSASNNMEPFYGRLWKLSDQEFCYLIRKAIAGRSDSKLPGTTAGIAMYQIAEQSGCDNQAVEAEQLAIATKRQGTLKVRIKDLEKLAKKLTAKKEVKNLKS